MGLPRFLLHRVAITALLVADLGFALCTTLSVSPEGMLLRPGRVSRTCEMMGPSALLFDDHGRLVLRNSREVGVDPEPPALPCIGQVWSEPRIDGSGLWFPCVSRVRHVVVVEPSRSFPPELRDRVRKEFCGFVHRKEYGNASVPDGYADLLDTGDGSTTVVKPWGCAHDAAFVVLVMLSLVSWVRSPVSGRELSEPLRSARPANP